VLGTMSHSPESQEPGGLGTGLLQALVKQVNRFHAQSDVALHCCCLALAVAIGWSGFSGSTSIYMNFIRASAKET